MTSSGPGGVGEATFRRSVAYNVLAQSSVFVFGLFNAVLSAQVLGAGGKGQLAIYILAGEIAIVLMMLGLNTALQYHASRDEFRSPRTLNTAAVFALGCTITFFALVQLAFALGQGDRVLPAPFNSHFFRLLIAGHFFFFFFGQLLISILNSHKLFEYTSKIRITTIAFISVAYAIFFYLDRSGARVVLVDHYYFAFAADQVLYVSLGLWVYVKFVSPGGASWSRTLLPRAKIGKLVSFGLFPWVSGFLMRAVMKLDYWFVEEFAGLESLGLYSVASNIGETLFLIPNTVGLVVLSFVADPATREDSTHRTASATRLFFFAMIVGSLVLALVSSQLFAFAFGEEFRASGPLLNRLLWGIVPFSLANIIIGYLLGTKRLKPVVVSASIGLAILLTLDFALVPRMGASGAAVGRAVAFNAMALYLVVHFKHASGMPYRRFLLPSLADIQLIKGLIHKLLGRQRT